MEGIAHNTVLHIQVNAKESMFSRTQLEQVIRINVGVKLRLWRYLEWKFCKVLIEELKTLKTDQNFTHVIFHIAYPGLVFYNRLKPYLPHKCLIIEHWSAYHFNFHSSRKLNRIARIFHRGIPLVVVSDELGRSIQRFSKKATEYTVIPNVVDEAFYYEESVTQENHYLMSAWWKSPKKPLEFIQAFANAYQSKANYRLHIAGDGPLILPMKNLVVKLGLTGVVTFLGVLDPERLRKELCSAKYFVMPTDYETFSVSCAEALACGCPVLANDVGALSEVLRNGEGRLVGAGESWENVLHDADSTQFDRKLIAEQNKDRYKAQRITSDFKMLLDRI